MVFKKQLLSLFLLLTAFQIQAQQKHIFSFDKAQFLLDGQPFQIIGEMHPARISKQYWRQRIQMAKAMGCNTIAAIFLELSRNKKARATVVVNNTLLII